MFYSIYGGGPCIEVINNNNNNNTGSSTNNNEDTQSLASTKSPFVKVQAPTETSKYWEEHGEGFTEGILGLRNISYYCYMNAVM